MLSQQELTKYQEMGFSSQEIQSAAKTARQRKVDILDVLLKTFPEPQNQRPPPTYNQARPNHKPEPSFKYRPYFKPRDKLKTQKYNCVYTEEEGGIKEQIVVEEIREKGFPPVLENVSNCCYLNSLLMAYYLMPELVKIVMRAVPLEKSDLDSLVSNNLKNKRIQSSYSLLRSLQKLFSNLTLSTKKMLNPSDVLHSLVDSFGNKIAYGEQKDLNEMNHHFISRLQQCLYYTKQNLENLKKQGAISSGIKSNIISPIKEKQAIERSGASFQLKDILFGTKIQISEQGQQIQKQQSQFLSFLLNPVHGNLYKCLDEQFHYEVDDEGVIINKDVWIVKQPEYLFFYFQRTGYDKNTGAVKLKNRVDFDFKIYLDRYLYKNKQTESKKNPVLIEHIKKRDQLTKQISYCRSLINSLQQSHQNSRHLSKQIIQIPSSEPFKKYLSSLQFELNIHQKSISELESRKDPYDLKYIICHRGSISSGHYWGYGYSGNWWRYDLQNSKVDEETIFKQIENGDTVVYALIYTRSQLHINPSFDKFLRVPEPDLLNMEEYYDWIQQSTQQGIVNENLKREYAVEERRIWQSFEQITLEYDELLCEANRLKITIEESGGEQPYLSSFLVYLRSLSKQPSNSFKLYCLNTAIKKVTKKYSLLQQPNQKFAHQLRQVIKSNISPQNIPDKFNCSKFDLDKIHQKEQEYNQRLRMRLYFNLLFQNLKNERWSESADCALLILDFNVKDSPDYNYAKQLLSVLILKLHDLGQTIPRNYMKCLSSINQTMSSRISSFVKITEIIDKSYSKVAMEAVTNKINEIPSNAVMELGINKIHFDVIRKTMMDLKPIVDRYKKLVTV